MANQQIMKLLCMLIIPTKKNIMTFCVILAEIVWTVWTVAFCLCHFFRTADNKRNLLLKLILYQLFDWIIQLLWISAFLLWHFFWDLNTNFQCSKIFHIKTQHKNYIHSISTASLPLCKTHFFLSFSRSHIIRSNGKSYSRNHKILISRWHFHSGIVKYHVQVEQSF